MLTPEDNDSQLSQITIYSHVIFFLSFFFSNVCLHLGGRKYCYTC